MGVLIDQQSTIDTGMLHSVSTVGFGTFIAFCIGCQDDWPHAPFYDPKVDPISRRQTTRREG